MPEDRISEIEDTIDDLFGLHPPSWMLVRDTAETILRLAELGNVVLIGRGANVITSGLEHVFHVRLVAPLENRLESVQQSRHMSAKEALAFIQTEDKGRRRYLKKYFHKNIDDPLLYHLVINTGVMPQDQAVGVLCDAVLSMQTSHTPARLQTA
jgi:cytidylate kinase